MAFPTTSVNGGKQVMVREHSAHPEEWLSIVVALLMTFLATTFLWVWPDYQPQSNGAAWTIPVWIGFMYVLIQTSLLLVSATQVRALGVIDSVVAIVPLIAGVVSVVEALLGHLTLSEFQTMTLVSLFVAGMAEFLFTLWIRFVINRRTVSVASGGMS